MEKWILRGGRGSEISARFGVNPLLGKIIAARMSEDEAERFLSADQSLPDSYLLPDIDKAVRILSSALEKGYRIRIIGDYDVDGITSTAILTLGLRYLADKLATSAEAVSEIDFRIPERIGDGYGFNVDMAQEIIDDGVQLVLTCDNGIREFSSASLLKKAGIPLVITDHHEIQIDAEGEELFPEADAIVNPCRKASRYPDKAICGAFVAFNLMRAMSTVEAFPDALTERLLGYAAIGTVCDVMPLTGCNRILVRKGLEILNQRPAAGTRSLAAVAGLTQISSYSLGYVIGPMLNAGGRLSSQNRYIQILLSDDEVICRGLAEELKELNQKRQKLTEEGIEAGILQAAKCASSERVKVIYLPELHESIAGLVAGKLKERLHQPSFVITKGADGLKGSGRSIEAYNMFAEMCKVSDLFVKFGGHPMAAGFSLKCEPGREEEAAEEMRRRLNACSTLTDEDCVPVVYIDAAVSMQDFSISAIDSLSILEPFGVGNPRPVFAQKGLLLKRMFPLGKSGTAFKLLLTDGSKAVDALLFRGDYLNELLTEEERKELATGRYLKDPIPVDICYQAELDFYMGLTKPKFIIQSMRRS